MNRITLATCLLSAAAALAPAASMAVTATASPQWPAGALQKDDPRVIAFYDGMCAQYADRQGLAGSARDAFIANCRASIPRVFPVGYDEAGGGGE
jgi:hypothetical protein